MWSSNSGDTDDGAADPQLAAVRALTSFAASAPPSSTYPPFHHRHSSSSSEQHNGGGSYPHHHPHLHAAPPHHGGFYPQQPQRPHSSSYPGGTSEHHHHHGAAARRPSYSTESTAYDNDRYRHHVGVAGTYWESHHRIATSENNSDEQGGGMAYQHQAAHHQRRGSHPQPQHEQHPPRGKPEAMAAKLAAASRLEQKRLELLQEQDDDEPNTATTSTAAAAAAEVYSRQDDDDDEDEDGESALVFMEEATTARLAALEHEAYEGAMTSTGSIYNDNKYDDAEDEEEEEEAVVVVSEPPSKKPAPSAAAAASAASKSTLAKSKRTTSSATTTPSKRSSNSKKKAVTTTSSPLGNELLLSQPAPRITELEYTNLEALMVQFCKVPLLAEFSRPVSLLHPELVASYSKIVSHPVDMGHVCRGIRRRQYTSTRNIRLEMWRVFANCVKFHSSPNNKDAVPSFVSIALHLREYFNNLWQEYMLPSDLPHDAPEHVAVSMRIRAEDRIRRMENAGVLVLSNSFTRKTALLIGNFIDQGGCVDGLDVEPILVTTSSNNSSNSNRDIVEVVKNLRNFQAQLLEIADSPDEYTIDQLGHDLKRCYTAGDIFEDNPALQRRVGNRIERLFWKRAMPLHEANSRGVTQSSIWGNVAAAIWARDSSKKPYWPALCLGILPPEDQREGWHDAVTERNELRLPVKLRAQLLIAKQKCEQAQKRQSLSYFLVEFLGTHEFIWVRETDIIEKFDQNDDPNTNPSLNKKKPSRSSRSGAASVVGSKTYTTALEECTWAVEEYETVLQDVFDEDEENHVPDEEDEELNYSYALLAQSDDEADAVDDHGYKYNEEAMTLSDVDEANWLLSHDGMIDLTRKKPKKPPAKKKAPVAPKKPAPAPKAVSTANKEKKISADAAAKKKTEQLRQRAREREDKKEFRELEKRRKKRTRDREKAVKDEARKSSKKRKVIGPSEGEDERGLSRDKKARANAIVKAYVSRMAQRGEYKSLAFNAVMTLPAAMVDSNGLLGMALAFRAASGELSMPGDNEEQAAKVMKPWTAIDTKGPKTSAERVQKLRKQIELIGTEMKRVRANTQRRKELAQVAEKTGVAMTGDVEADGDAARLNRFAKKKKKVSPKTGKDKVGESAVIDLEVVPDMDESVGVAESAPASPDHAESDGMDDDRADEDDGDDLDDMDAKLGALAAYRDHLQG